MTRESTDGLSRLYAEATAPELPEPGLLARYATDPNSLSEEEKRSVEAAMESPLVADELATLRDFDLGRLDADRRARAGGPRWAGWLSARPVQGAAALAVAVAAAWLMWPTGVEEAESPRRIAERREVPEAPRPDRRPAPQLAEVEPTPELAQPREPEPSMGTPEASVEPAPAPLPERIAEASKVEVSPRPVPLDEAAERDASEPILLAMVMPVYAAPADAAARDPVFAVFRSESGDVRIGLVAAAPAHVTHAWTATPTLHWHLERVLRRGDLYLSIVDADDEPVVLDRRLVSPDTPGLQRTSLAGLGIALPAGRELRWSIAHRPDDDSPPLDFAMGWIEVREASPERKRELAGLPVGARAAFLAQAGYWHAALEAALVAVELAPDDGCARLALARLLEQAGREALAPEVDAGAASRCES